VTKLLYFDCFAGASGDMVLGALLDLGLPLDHLREQLGTLAIDYGSITAERVLRAGVSASKFRLIEREPAHAHHQAQRVRDRVEQQQVATIDSDPAHVHDGHGHDHEGGHAAGHALPRRRATGPRAKAGHHRLSDIATYIDRSRVTAAGKDRAIEMFRRLAEAEATIHGVPIERVHLHEVGAVDSIIDIVGAVIGMEWLGAADVVASPINVGSGTVRCAHGVFPVPAPATASLLKGVPVYAGGVAHELTTPTGALLVTSYARTFGPMPPMRIAQMGYGAGDRDFPGFPNVLRVMVGERDGQAAVERIVSIECEIDDMNPQLFGPLMDKLYAGGALDVFYAPVQMKKNRPGTLVTVISRPDSREDLTATLFAETTTIGVRFQEMFREPLDRETKTLATPLGPIRFKVARRLGRVVNAAPEFEDCARAAADHGLPIKEVQAIAIKAWLESGHTPGESR
jgi:pyridinium-3,5-bisthiocarboxylic acid mononucleotide nickel chelatase